MVVCFPGLEKVQQEKFQSSSGEQLLFFKCFWQLRRLGASVIVTRRLCVVEHHPGLFRKTARGGIFGALVAFAGNTHQFTAEIKGLSVPDMNLSPPKTLRSSVWCWRGFILYVKKLSKNPAVTSGSSSIHLIVEAIFLRGGLFC